MPELACLPLSRLWKQENLSFLREAGKRGVEGVVFSVLASSLLILDGNVSQKLLYDGINNIPNYPELWGNLNRLIMHPLNIFLNRVSNFYYQAALIGEPRINFRDNISIFGCT